MKSRKIMATDQEDRLSHLPDSVRLHILSLLQDRKEIVRSSVLSKKWQCFWKSVPLSLCFCTEKCESNEDIVDFVDCLNKELLVLRSFQDIQKFSVNFRYEMRYKRDINLWVYFATQAAIVKDFTLKLYYVVNFDYEFPQFAYKNSSLRCLVLRDCQLNPSGCVSWSSLVSLSIGDLKLTDGVMEKLLSGCPNLESLEIDRFWGIYRLDISSPKLRKLILTNCLKETDTSSRWLKIFAPHVQDLQLLGCRHEMRMQLTNVASLVTVVLNFTPHFEFDDDFFAGDDDDGDDNDGDGVEDVESDDDFFAGDDGDGVEDDFDKDCRYLKELLHRLVHVKNLELGPWCIEFLSILELRGWHSPASSRKSLTLNAALVQEDFPAICNLLQSSSDLETLVIDWSNWTSRYLLSKFIEKDENTRSVEKHVFDSSLLHLRTIKIINFYGSLRANKFIMPLVKHLLKNAEVLEKMVIAASLRYNKFQGSNVSQDFVEMAQEFLRFPRSSKHAVVDFSY